MRRRRNGFHDKVRGRSLKEFNLMKKLFLLVMKTAVGAVGAVGTTMMLTVIVSVVTLPFRQSKRSTIICDGRNRYTVTLLAVRAVKEERNTIAGTLRRRSMHKEVLVVMLLLLRLAHLRRRHSRRSEMMVGTI
jgi:hypothetical protein